MRETKQGCFGCMAKKQAGDDRAVRDSTIICGLCDGFYCDACIGPHYDVDHKCAATPPAPGAPSEPRVQEIQRGCLVDYATAVRVNAWIRARAKEAAQRLLAQPDSEEERAEARVVEAAMRWWREWEGQSRPTKVNLTHALTAACAELARIRETEGA